MNIPEHPTLEDIKEPPTPPNHELFMFVGEPRFEREYLMPVDSTRIVLPYADGSKWCLFQRGQGSYKDTFVFMGYV